MAPIDVQDEFREQEANLPVNTDDAGLTRFMTRFANELTKKYNFSTRQISWTIKMHINEGTIDALLDELDELETYDGNLHYSPKINNIVKEIAKLEAKNCIMSCFDQNFRVNLNEALLKANIDEDDRLHIIYDICGFNSKQFADPNDQEAYISLELASWLDDDEPNLKGWEEGLEEEYEDIMSTYGPVLISVLTHYLNGAQLEELFNKSFAF